MPNPIMCKHEHCQVFTYERSGLCSQHESLCLEMCGAVTVERDKYLRQAADLSTDVARLRRALEMLWDEANDASRVVGYVGTKDVRIEFSRPCRDLVLPLLGLDR